MITDHATIHTLQLHVRMVYVTSCFGVWNPVYTTHHEKQALVLILLNGMDHMCVCVMSRSPLLQVNLQVIIIMKMLNSIV
jgi:hypothetical protein